MSATKRLQMHLFTKAIFGRSRKRLLFCGELISFPANLATYDSHRPFSAISSNHNCVTNRRIQQKPTGAISAIAGSQKFYCD
jgi:hypothetical protein